MQAPFRRKGPREVVRTLVKLTAAVLDKTFLREITVWARGCYLHQNTKKANHPHRRSVRAHPPRTSHAFEVGITIEER
jgi:hypothetical protein